jgi:sugar phosphate isomerase/epimerase
MSYIFSGFADEAGHELEAQIRATKELGWKNIEMRFVKAGEHPSGNLHEISDNAFLEVVDRLGETDIRIHCFGSGIANGGKSIEKPFDVDLESTRRCAVRMPKLGAKFIRVMSYPIRKDTEDQLEQERFRRLREVISILKDVDVTVLHENCGNYGGMSWTYTLKMLENVPGMKLAFDMGNCFHDLDYNKPEPRPYQNAWEFYEHVRDHIAHLHIKDGHMVDGKHVHTYPGEGTCDVKRIIDDLLARGYKGVFSIEPHIGVSPEFKDVPEAEGKYRTYVKHGQILESIMPKA